MGWFVYILECSDKSFYVGYTKDIGARLKAHNSGKGAVYTATHRPVSLLYHEPHQTKESAIKREIQIKKWSRAKKQALINGDLANLHQLSKRRHQ
jgi:putative endonuclease